MTATEERAELKRIAQEVFEELRKFTGSITAYRKRIDIVINHLLSDADKLALAAADEVSSGEVVVKKQVVFKSKALEVGDAVHRAEEAVLKGTAVLSPSGRKRKTCSICRQPGHWGKNCPNAHVVQDAKKQQVAARDAAKPKRRKKS